MSLTHVDPEGSGAPAPPAGETLPPAPRPLFALLYAYQVPLSIIVINVVGTLSLVALVTLHGVSWTDLAVFVTTYVLGMLGIEVGMHRYFSHRAFEATPALRTALLVLAAMGGQGSALVWTTTHRRHHRFADTDSDPHSPKPRGSGIAGALRGLWHGHFAWYFRDATGVTFKEIHRYSRDLVTDRRLMMLDSHFWSWVGLGMLLPALAGLAITGTVAGAITAFFWGGPIRMLFVNNVVWAVNSIAHAFGKQPYETRDDSRDVAWLAIPSLGASWHNTHHAFPGSARTALRPEQIDPGFWFVAAFEALGLAHRVQVAKPRRDVPSPAPD